MSIVARNIFLFLLIVLPLTTHGKTTVVITNSLAGNLDLTVHCKSKNDDLGEHLLHPKQSYSFSFQSIVVRGSTLFFCTFSWQGACHRFDIFDQDRDFGCDGRTCNRDIKQDGPCLPEQKTPCLPWKSNC
ncbi:uncharacterized protein DS421_4g129140 [Arachis hypogaea]|nr:uncharacterized protein DS421_4g129140 [Arachis hypogaea]